MNKRAEYWDLVITSKRGWFNFDLQGIWKYRDLIILFVRRDIVSFYKQTILGPLYFVITPVISTLINMLIFGTIANLSTDGTPQFLFYMSGNLIWGYFSTCLGGGKSIFQNNSGLFSQVYFPRLCVPISQNISALLRLLIQLILFIIIFIFFLYRGNDMNPSIGILFFPLILLQCSLLGLGMGILMASLTTKYKDLNFIYNIFIRFWMYASPVVYPLSVIPKEWHFIASFNPMVGIIELSRNLIFGVSVLNKELMMNGIIMTLLILFIGLLMFNRVEKTFLDTV